jgi:deazaflavin-dependent oxidoreductase (nitroreductase family)
MSVTFWHSARALLCLVCMQFQEEFAKLQFIYVTTIGRRTGLEREIEIWFVERAGRLYILAEHFFKANWVRNIQNHPRLRVRLGKQSFSATGRVLDEIEDAEAWQAAQRLCREKYGWGDGLPVEITPGDAL